MPLFTWENRVFEGATRTFLKYIGATLIFNKLFFSDSEAGPILNYRWSNLTDQQKQNVLNVYIQISMYGLLMVSLGSLGDASGDDEWKRRLGRVPGDLVQGWNVMDLIRAEVNPTIVMPRMYQTATSMNTLVNSWFNDTTIKQGKHKGERPGAAGLRKEIPIVSQYDRLFGE